MDFQHTDLTESMKRDYREAAEIVKSLVDAVVVEIANLNPETTAKSQAAYREAAKYLMGANPVQHLLFWYGIYQTCGPAYVAIVVALGSIMEKQIYADEIAELKKTREAARFN